MGIPKIRGRQRTARGPDATHQGILLGSQPFIVIRSVTYFVVSMINMLQ